MSSAIEVRDSPMRGILLCCVAVFFFTSMTAVGKQLLIDLPIGMVVWGRYFFHLALLMLLFAHRLPRLLESRRKSLQVLRSVAVLVATLCAFAALNLMPLTDVVAITFVSPLIVTGLAVLVLKERVPLRHWIAVIVGFAGVLLIVRPDGDELRWVTLLPVVTALFYAIYQIATRLARNDADAVTSLFYTALVGAIVMTLAVPFVWQTPTPTQWALMVTTGVLGGTGHFAMIHAFQIAPASVISPFTYSQLIWATLYGYLLFADLPDLQTLVGAAIIVASGLYVLRDRSRS